MCPRMHQSLYWNESRGLRPDSALQVLEKFFEWNLSSRGSGKLLDEPVDTSQQPVTAIKQICTVTIFQVRVHGFRETVTVVLEFGLLQ
jgi:hypothetical protein